MLLLRSALASSLLWTAQASVLFVSSYDGNVSTVSLGNAGAATGGDDGCGAAKLQVISRTTGCAGSPSFLALDRTKGRVYCVDEGLQGNSSLSSFGLGRDGSLQPLAKAATLTGPVFVAPFGPQNNAVAVAHFGGEAMTTWDVSASNQLRELQTEKFQLAQKGPREEQNAAKPHQAILDPTGTHLVVPDLGADLLRIFRVGSAAAVTALPPVAVAKGNGPRHVAFANMTTQANDARVYMFTLTELSARIIAHKVTYPGGVMKLEELYTMGVHGDQQPREVPPPPPTQPGQPPQQVFPSEIMVMSNAMALVAVRNENKFTIPNHDPQNSTNIVSDTLVNFKIDANGNMKNVQEVPCGGRFPRHFSVNKAETLVAVGLQKDGIMTLLRREANGLLAQGFVGYAEIGGEVTSAIFSD